jgi:predicted DNA-binding transcriptional regulator AlpA
VEAILQQTITGTEIPPFPILEPLADSAQIAALLQVPSTWVRFHSKEIPGHQALGRYIRFRRAAVEQWLGGHAPVLKPEEVSQLLRVPTSWVYANAEQIPGHLRLGRYVRFRRATIAAFVGGSEACQ